MNAHQSRTLVATGAALAVVLSAGALAVKGEQAPAPSSASHRVLTNQEDRQRLMDMLKITMFPSGPGAYLASTYDEHTANPYPNLPNPLVMNNGTKVTTAGQWPRRRSEILELFSREVYGRRPAVMPKVTWSVVRTVDGEVRGPGGAKATGAPVTTKYLVGHVDNSAYPAVGVDILATLSIPKGAKGPVPVVLAFGGGSFEGAPATPNPCAPPPPPAGAGRAGGAFGAGRVGGAPGAGRAGAAGAPAGPPPPPSAPEQIYARGWGYATVSTASIQADNGQGLTCGIIGLVNKGQPRKLDDWGVLSAWGWGMSKVLDYLQTDKDVDATKVAVHGHSRTGKAALVAMAYDERFANGFISSSGQAGAKLHRRKYGEAIENIAALNEYHWMAGNYLKYAGRWDTLPVDSHQLVALVAPRPVFLSTGKGPDTNPDGTVKMMQPGDPGFVASRGPIEQQAANINDAWVDPKGTFLAGLHASPVYQLLGKKGMSAKEFPAIETGVMEGDVAFRQHAAGHTPGPNWPVFLDFAGRYWK